MAEGGRDENVEVGFEEAMSWLPSHVVDEAICHTHTIKEDEYVNHRRPTYIINPALSKLPLHNHALQHSKSSFRSHYRTKYPPNWASGGPGMQAIFLDSGQKSCGTGVFLPRRVGGNDNLQSSKRPACSPVLLPARVVQALNLNVHELGLQISRRQLGARNNSKIGDSNAVVRNKNGKDISAQCHVVPHNENTSPEIFLPKEWTY